ncbi:MAG: ABC transporter permease [Thermoanaerobaculia bacterium]|nr:ABC transporter permease [Thermoanaerobaculia bacterium]
MTRPIRYGGPDVQGELDDEIRFHLEMAERELIAAGRTPEEARREALRRFGRVTDYRSACLEVHRRRRVRDRRRRWLVGTGLELRQTWRALARRPGFTMAATLTLGLGIGLTTAIFSLVNSIVLQPLPFEEPERLVRLYSAAEDRGWSRFDVSLQDLVDWHEQTDVLEDVTLYRSFASNSVVEGSAHRVDILQAWDSFFPLFGVAPHLGRLFTAGDDPFGAQVVLSFGFWRNELGGDEDIVGTDLYLDGKAHEIIGVAAEGFEYPSARYEVFGLLSRQADSVGTRSQRYLGAVGRLRSDGTPGEALEKARAALATVAARLAEAYPDSNAGWEARTMPLQEWLVGDVRETLILLWAAVGFLLLVACSNVAHLLLVRGQARRQELATRAALGASTRRLARQLVTESMVLSLLGGAAGVALALGVVRWLPRIATGSLPRLTDVSVDGAVLLFALGTALVTGLLFGAIPAWRFGRLGARESSTVLLGVRGGSRGSRGATTALVLGEIALACVLLVSAGLVVKSLQGLLHQDLGFDPEEVLAFRLAPAMDFEFMRETDPQALRAGWDSQRTQRADLFDRILERLESSPLVLHAAAANELPMAGGRWADEVFVGGLDESVPVYVRVVTPPYFSTLGIPLVAGRGVDLRDGEGDAWINQAAASRFWPGERDPTRVGRTFRLGDEPHPWFDGGVTVRGIVGDVYFDPETPARPMVYLPIRGATTGFAGTWDMKFVVRAAPGVAATSLVAPARAAVAEAVPELPIFDVSTLEARRGVALREERLVSSLFGAFAISALALAAVGLYGLMAFAVTSERHAIGVRLALGASPAELVRIWLRRGLTLGLCGSLLGLGASLLVVPLLRSQLYDIQPRDPWSFLLAAITLLAAAGLASIVPAHKASQVDPIEVLRAD